MVLSSLRACTQDKQLQVRYEKLPLSWCFEGHHYGFPASHKRPGLQVAKDHLPEGSAHDQSSVEHPKRLFLSLEWNGQGNLTPGSQLLLALSPRNCVLTTYILNSVPQFILFLLTLLFTEGCSRLFYFRGPFFSSGIIGTCYNDEELRLLAFLFKGRACNSGITTTENKGLTRKSRSYVGRYFMKQDSKNGKYASGFVIGVGIGLVLGVVIGLVTNDLGLWLPIGVAMGTGLGVAFGSLSVKDMKEDHDKAQEGESSAKGS